MPGIRHLALIAAAIATAMWPVRARAQQGGAQLSFDATFGRSFGGGGGERSNRNGTALDGMLAWRARGRGLHGVLGFNTGVQGRSSGNDCLAVPGLDCVPDFPRVFTLGILFGAEQRSAVGAVRLLAGPTHYRVDGGGSTLGGQARLEYVSPSFHQVAAVVSARGGAAWNLDRQDFRFGAIGVGLGIYR